MIIKIKNLVFKTTIGVYSWEQKQKTQLTANIEIETDDIKAMKTDNIGDAIDYDFVLNQVRNCISKKRYDLIEALVGSIIEAIMCDRRIKRATVEIDKPRVYEDIESFSVSETRYNNFDD